MQKKALQILIGTLLSTIYFVLPTTPAQAATIPLSGYAWSENVGWINFSNSPLYSVYVNTATGNFSGYAWSEHMGWLSFTSTDTASCGANANLNTQSGVVTGWAKFLSNGECVKLNPPDGVTYSSASSEFSGYAWGGDMVGWIKWKKTGNPSYGVISLGAILAPPTAPSNLTATPFSKTQINLTWTNTEQGTKVRIERSLNNTTYSQIYEAPNANQTSYSDTGLSAGTLYYYRVKAFNNNSDESPYSNTASTSTLPYTAIITVDVTPNNASWTITNNRDTTQINRTGDTSVTVYPSGQGTTYTITPGTAPSGYDNNPTVTNSVTSTGTAVTLFDTGTATFTVVYNESIVFCFADCGGPGDGGSGGGGGQSGTEFGNMSIQKGGSRQYDQETLTKTLISGPTRPVLINVTGAVIGSNVGVEYDANRDCSPNCSTVIKMWADPNAPVGTHNLTITATPQGYGSPVTDSFTLTITAAVELNVTCAPSPNSAQVGQTVTWTATPSLGTPPYTFEYWTGDLPTGGDDEANPMSGSYSTTGSKSALGKFRDSKDVVATCAANPINIGVDPDFGEF